MANRWLLWVASTVVVLNLFDAIFTLCYTSAGLATESNPLMQGVLAASPVTFMVTKVALVSLCVLLLWRLGHRMPAMIGLLGASVMYVVLIGYHLTAVPALFARL